MQGETPRSTTHERPLACAGLDSSVGTEMIQQRLALLGKTLFLLIFCFYIVGNGLAILAMHLPLNVFMTDFSNVMHLAAAAVMGLLYVVAKRPPRLSLEILGLLDGGSLILCSVSWALMAAEPDNIIMLQTLLAFMVTAVARAILIPSTGTRTFWLTTFSSAPILAVAIAWHGPGTPPPGVEVSAQIGTMLMWLNIFLWLGVIVALATFTSRTIYGLRRQVAEATEIGQYTLETLLGSGGMGEVWRARHRMLIRPAAVKLIRPQSLGSSPGDPQVLLRRFEREARATAALKSPHTVQLYDFGVTDDGTLYYVMELLDGMDLDTLVRRFGPVPGERAIHILEQVCASLEDAHKNGLVHRDIKPANIVVGRLGSASDFVKVLDFGLVKLESARQSEDSVRLTRAGSTSGTPAFMAPEIALGEEGTDHRVDVYSLGCVAYWLVTGKLVFDGTSALNVMWAQANTPPPPPSSRVELPILAPLEALILECLEKDPDKRIPSAAVLRARLRAIVVAAPWSEERAERWWSVHAPAPAEPRPAADMLLSHEARPPRVIRHARP